MEFDFLSYLQTFLGPDHVDSEQITIAKLTGGFTNLTARAAFRTPLSLLLITKDSADESKSLTSVVLKYAPPHIASDPSQTLSVRRQDVEAAALQVLGPLLPGTKSGAEQNEKNLDRFHTPSLYFHDKANNILWMEDLGADAKPLIHVLRASSPALTQEEVKEMGAGLGQVIHHLQKNTSAWIASPPANLVDFQTPASEEIHTYLSQLTLKELTKGGMEETEALEISGIVLKGLQELRDEEPFWGMGDFWPESVLVYRENDTSQQLKFGLIDWEYFGPSSVPAEIGMFLAHLHYHMLTSTDFGTQNRIRAFANGMCDGYTNARLSSNTAMGSSVYPSKAFQWKTLVAYGRELINAVQLYNDASNHNDEHTRSSNYKETRDRVVGVGVTSIKAAGSAYSEVDLGCLVGAAPDVAAPDLSDEAGNVGRTGEEDTVGSLRIYEAFDVLRFRVYENA